MLLPAAAAAPAIQAPRPWLAACVVAAFLVSSARHYRRGGGGSAAVLLAPAQALASALRSIPLAILWLIPAIGLCVAVPVVLGGVRWFLSDGMVAAVTGARLAAVAWSPALLAAAVCFGLLRLILRSGGGTANIRVRFERVHEITLTLLASASVIAIAIATFIGPPASLTVLDVVPRPLSGQLQELHAIWAQAQADAVVRCLDRRTDVTWSAAVGRTAESPRLSLLVEQVTDSGARATREDLTGLTLALHNQMLGIVGQITIRRDERYDPLVVRRVRLDLRARPLRETESLAAAAGVGVDVLPESTQALHDGLLCGARLP